MLCYTIEIDDFISVHATQKTLNKEQDERWKIEESKLKQKKKTHRKEAGKKANIHEIVPRMQSGV